MADLAVELAQGKRSGREFHWNALFAGRGARAR
jgi:hypothetical protein